MRRFSTKPPKLLADPMAYTDETKLHAALAHLRTHAPVSWVEVSITTHSGPSPSTPTSSRSNATTCCSQIGRARSWSPPKRTSCRQHGPCFAWTARNAESACRSAQTGFVRAMRQLKVRIDELAKIYVDKMMAAGNQCDFVQEVAVNYPLHVILSLLGLPESDFLACSNSAKNSSVKTTRVPARQHSRRRTPEYCSTSSTTSMHSPSRAANTRPRISHRKSPMPAPTASRCRSRNRYLLSRHRYRRSRHD